MQSSGNRWKPTAEEVSGTSQPLLGRESRDFRYPALAKQLMADDELSGSRRLWLLEASSVARARSQALLRHQLGWRPLSLRCVGTRFFAKGGGHAIEAAHSAHLGAEIERLGTLQFILPLAYKAESTNVMTNKCYWKYTGVSTCIRILSFKSSYPSHVPFALHRRMRS